MVKGDGGSSNLSAADHQRERWSMKANEIKVGGHYLAKVSDKMVTVRVDEIKCVDGFRISSPSGSRRGRPNRFNYVVTNLSTGCKTTFYSAAKFRGPAPERTETIMIDQVTFGGIPLSEPATEEGVNTQIQEVAKALDAKQVRAMFEAKDAAALQEGEHRDPPTSQPGSSTPTQEGEQSFPPTVSESIPAPSVGTIGATGAAPTSDRTEEGEQCLNPTQPVPSEPTTSEATGALTAELCRTAQQGAALSATSVGNLANRIASASQQRQRGTPVVGMVPNEEQEAIIAEAQRLFGEVRVSRDPDSSVVVLVVVAGAGSGKTATCKMLEEILRGRGQYTAFNRPLVDEARPKFKRAKCSTTHQLAFHATGKPFAHRLPGDGGPPRMRSSEVAARLGIQPITVTLKGAGPPDENGKPTDKQKVIQPEFLAGQVVVAIRKFCQSADREIDVQHFKYIDGIDVPTEDGKRGRENNDLVRDRLLGAASMMWDDIMRTDGQLPFTHDCYVKIWQLGRGDDRPIIAADYILLDEYQDTAPVFLDVLAQQRHALLVMVGDDNQRIYEWRGAVNAGDHFPDAPRCMLSQSYRFGQAVADVANAVLGELEQPTKLRMRGNPCIPSRVGSVAQPRCFIYRTNAGAIGQVMSEVDEGRRPCLLGGKDYVSGLIKWCEAALDLQSGRSTQHPELSCFEDWDELEEYSKTDEGADLRLMVKLVNTFGAQEIVAALKNMPKEEQADCCVITAHKSKGREWDTVRLGADFPTINKMEDPELRLLYVAATRAKLTLDVSECPPFCGAEDQLTKKWIPGLKVTYTKPMPSQEDQDDWVEAQKWWAEREAKNGQTSALQPARNDATTPAVASESASPTPTPIATPDVPTGRVTPAIVEGRFTWCKWSDKWCIRGEPNVNVGSKVKVARKDGSTSTVIIKEVVKRFGDAWIYAS